MTHREWWCEILKHGFTSEHDYSLIVKVQTRISAADPGKESNG